MEIESSFVCVFCFQVNATLVDASAGEYQEYTEDCQVCCRPNDLRVSVDPSLGEASIESLPQS
ncbi:MAG TPA: CPXCG motif-containing cysteine-rich protein [Bacteroidota bacterium]|nr:CPXCG motif-containing cysteine-rich protein [Bacteroidota bacterium]